MDGTHFTSEPGGPPAATVVAAMLLSLCGSPSNLAAQCQTANLDSVSLSYCVRGGGPPTFVLAAGAGMSSATWASLVPPLAELGTVVSFDRPGLGRSPAGPLPRSPARISSELAALLDHIDLPTPFVLVGHSMGGIHVVGAATRSLGETAAVVLLDSPPPDFESRRLELLTSEQRRARSDALAQGAARAGTVIGDERAAARERPMRIEAGALGSIPLIVVVADRQDFGPGDQEAHRALWLELSHAFLELSEDARLVVAEGSGHMVHVDRADLVLDILRSVVSQRW